MSAPLAYPTTLRIPIGGCSSDQNITLPFLPPTEVNASFIYSGANALTSSIVNTDPGFTVLSPEDFNSSTLTKTFKICANSSVPNTSTYTFKAVVSGTDQRYYTATNPDLSITAYNPPTNITITTNFSIPKGGCSIGTISITKLPTSDVTVSINNLTENLLYTDLAATFVSTSTSLNQSFLLCSNESAVLSSTGVLGLALSGTNANDYLLLNGDNTSFTITPAPQPVTTVVPATVYTAGYGVFGVSSNI